MSHTAIRIWQERPGEISWLCSCGCHNKHCTLPTELVCGFSLDIRTTRPSSISSLFSPNLAVKNLYVLVFIVFLSGCSLLRTITPGGVTLSDAEWTGIKSGSAVSIIGTLDPQIASAALLLEALGQSDPLGVILPVTPPGETRARWILCTEEYVKKCQDIPINARVHFSGQAIGPGLLWKPSRLTADDFND